MIKILGKEINGIIFDIDGVLLDSMKIWTDLGARYVIKHGKEPKPGLAETLFSMSMEQGAAYLQANYLPEQTPEEIAEGLKGLLQEFYYHEVLAKPGVQALMKILHQNHIPMTAATSSPRTHVEKALARNGLLPYIDQIFTSEELGSSKHSPEIYDRAALSMDTRREETCVFEDSLYALTTAAEAGYFTVGVYDEDGERNQKGMKQTADVYISDMKEMQQYVHQRP